MKRFTPRNRRVRTTATHLRWLPRLLVLALLAPAAVRADPTYKIEPILKLRDTVPGTQLKPHLRFEVGSLNDRGQLLFGTINTPYDPTSSELTFLYDNGTFRPIALPEGEAPIGKWPKRFDIDGPTNMNQSGNVVFAMSYEDQDAWVGTFLWEYQTQKATAVALTGMAAVDGLTFGQPAGGQPTINNNNEIAFAAEVKDAAGKVLGVGVFFRQRDGKLQRVALPGDDLPGGAKVREAFFPSINDAGRIAFLATARGRTRPSAYLWEKGTINPLAQIDTDAPGGGKIVRVVHAQVNNKHAAVLVEAILNNANTGPLALYRFAEGKLIPVAVPGQPMPQGGKFRSLWFDSVSYPNEAGQHAFLALLEGGLTAAYLLAADGTPSLILKSGTTTELGRVAQVGAAGNSWGSALNNQGQVALVLKIDVLPPILALLTPVTQ